MRGDDQVRVMVFVDVPPRDAFDAFTDDVDLWWRQGVRFRAFPHEGHLAFEERARFVEVADDGRRHEIGVVRVWEPGAHLVFEWRGVNFAEGEATEVELTFTPKRGGTEVLLVHRGFASLRPDHPVRHGAPVQAFLRSLGLYWGDLLSECRLHATRRPL